MSDHGSDAKQSLTTRPEAVTIDVPGMGVRATAIPYRVGDIVHLDAIVELPDGTAKIHAEMDVESFQKSVERAKKSAKVAQFVGYLVQGFGRPVIHRALTGGDDVLEFPRKMLGR